ncbi:MAG: hypothetical protein QOF55_918 [Thermoleophilaceae bacterium]|nr:hypothetical protein [Thermoleophilaceae bacterium]
MRGLVGRGVAAAVALAATMAIACAATALAHVERTAYWPDPKPDTSVKPAAGGKVPKARSLASALKAKPPGQTRVVCQKGSLKRAKRAIRTARKQGVTFRPTETRKFSRKQAAKLLKLNRKLFKRCRYFEIQPAVTASRNNDRVVIMPGVYTEPTSRKVPAFPPECDQYRTDNSDHGAGAVSYEYQFHCPNAQSLVSVIGRGEDTGPLPASGPNGRPDPHGLPNAGPCIRCNLQIEGSGPSPDDVVIDAGRVASGNGAPIEPKKDVTVKVDRADGFVLRNVTARHATEHDVYVLETDGYLLKENKYMYAGEYGTLTFTSDHGVTRTCDAAGNGDSGVYPGGAPDSRGSQRVDSFYPKDRLNQLITHCDSHHNNLGYSGTMGNATHIVDNNFYDNTTGIATDSFYAGGHPGYPQGDAVYENNRIYSNNFNVYAPESDVKSSVPVPIGVGMLIGGGNSDTLKGNYIYDNWRRGTMLMSVPDAISCAPNTNGTAPPCTPKGAATTSNDNIYTHNVMSRSPGGKEIPNGVDFWWDEYASNTGNCWPDNKGQDGTPASITSDPPRMADDSTVPGFLPVKDCTSPNNSGLGDPQKESVLGGCAADFQNGTYDSTVCDWFTMPSQPQGKGTNGPPPGVPVDTNHVSGAGYPSLCTLVGGLGGTLTCSPFQHRLG